MLISLLKDLEKLIKELIYLNRFFLFKFIFKRMSKLKDIQEKASEKKVGIWKYDDDEDEYDY